MTEKKTLLETYQSVKELIAYNLMERGVLASANEGLTTLAEKILNLDSSEKCIRISIIWDDNDNEKLERPDSIIVNLNQNGVIYERKELSSEVNWESIVTDLPRFDGQGTEYIYTVTGQDNSSYFIVENNYTLTYKLLPQPEEYEFFDEGPLEP